MTFISFAQEIKRLLAKIVDSPELHAKWLNTLSYLENCGARKIAACEHPTLVKEEMLKHAAEEFRHAHYLKQQIEKVASPIDTYLLEVLLGGTASFHYLTALDVKTARYLKAAGFSGQDLKGVAYLLVTYAIELRAAELYPIYEEILRKTFSSVRVKSILLEEKEHLEEMENGLRELPFGACHASAICSLEASLCKKWLKSIRRSINYEFVFKRV